MPPLLSFSASFSVSVSLYIHTPLYIPHDCVFPCHKARQLLVVKVQFHRRRTGISIASCPCICVYRGVDIQEHRHVRVSFTHLHPVLPSFLPFFHRSGTTSVRTVASSLSLFRQGFRLGRSRTRLVFSLVSALRRSSRLPPGGLLEQYKHGYTIGRKDDTKSDRYT